MGTFLGVPIIRIIVYWGLYWDPPILGNYHISGPIAECIELFDLRELEALNPQP